MQHIEIEIELPPEVDVEIETGKQPEVDVDAELSADVEVDLTPVQIVTYYDFIFEEI